MDIQGKRPPGTRTVRGPSDAYTTSTSGAIPEADFLVGDSLDDLHPVEVKRGTRSGQTRNQRLGYPKVNQHGAEVATSASKKNLVTGEVHDLEGVSIKKDRFIRLYEVDAVAIEAGQTTLDDVVSRRRGQLKPKPTPLQLPPAGGVRPGSGRTGDPGTDGTARGTDRRGRDASFRDRGTRSRGTGSRATGQRPAARAPAADPGRRPTSAATSPDVPEPGVRTLRLGVPDKAPNVRLRPGRVAFGVVRGLIIDQLVSMALAAFVGYFEKQVSLENQRHIANHWKEKVFPKVEPHIRDKIRLANDGSPVLPTKSRVYALVGWTVVMRQLTEDASDAVVFGVKFASGDPSFGEIFEDLEVSSQPVMVGIVRGRGKPKTKAHKRRIDRNDDDLVRYGYTQYILLHDPHVLRTANVTRTAAERHLKKLARVRAALPPEGRSSQAARLTSIEDDIRTFRFPIAYGRLALLRAAIDNAPSALTEAAKSLVDDLLNSATSLTRLIKPYDDEQRGLLNGLLGTTVAPGR